MSRGFRAAPCPSRAQKPGKRSLEWKEGKGEGSGRGRSEAAIQAPAGGSRSRKWPSLRVPHKVV